MTQPEDKSILREIVRIVESRRRVPDRVQVQAREYLITYLEDHRNRLDEALRRYDPDRLNMLFGQLASKIKYQFNRMVPARAVEARKATPPPQKSPSAAKPTATKPAKPTATKAAGPRASAAKPGAAKAPAPRAAAKKAPARKPVAKKAAAPRASERKPAAKKTAAKKPPAKKAKPTAKKHK